MTGDSRYEVLISDATHLSHTDEEWLQRQFVNAGLIRFDLGVTIQAVTLNKPYSKSTSPNCRWIFVHIGDYRSNQDLKELRQELLDKKIHIHWVSSSWGGIKDRLREIGVAELERVKALSM